MKKTLIFLGALGMGYVTYAQQGNVGINVESPQATLDIKPSTANLNGTTNEGILAPRLTKARIANIAAPVEGTLVYATDATGGTGARVAKITEKGYYYYDGTEWVKAGGAAGATLPAGTANNQVLKWNGTAWTPQADANTTYTGSTSVILRGTSFERAALTGDVTSAQNNNTVTINNGAVTGAKIANGTITADKLAPGVIPSLTEVDGIIGNEVTNATASKGLVRAGAGTNADPYTLGVADGGITNVMIANNAINSAKIQDGTVVAADLANNTVTGAKIANATITADKLAPGVIPSFTEVDAIIGNEVTNATASKGLVRAGAGTNADPYTLGVADGGITNAMIANNAVTGAKIANATITADKLAPGVIPAAQAEVDGIIGNEVTNATANRGLVRAGSGTAAAPYTLGVADGGITNAMIANNAINSAKIQDGTIVAADLANNAVTGAKIANATITADKLNAMGATNGQVLKWNGTAWAPATDEVGSGTATTPAEPYIVPEDAIVKIGAGTTSYTVDSRGTDKPKDQYITVNGPTSEVKINLPLASAAKGRKIIITNKTSSNVVINAGGNQAILGSESPSINKKGTGKILISDGENWYNLINY